ncbi:MAG: IclR family transcriptional regulator [Candidatus Rokubacteria bacterium]|nr:IclR family transcriptional regulator [Candidatus Rokubacteria bacterium]
MKSRARVPGRGYTRTASLLAALVDEPQGITASALAQRLDIPKSTLSLILRHFLELGIVERAHDRARIVIGPELVKLAFRIVSNLQLPRVARPHLEWLARETHENVYLGVQNGLKAIYIDRVDGTESVRVNVELGAPRPLHATAIGKLILAFSPPSLLEAVVRAEGLPALTPHTITDPTRLRRKLEEVRKRGFSTSDGENIDGLYAIAVPVIVRGRIVAGICICVPGSPGLHHRPRWAPKMLKAAQRISRDLTARPQPNGSAPSDGDWGPARRRRTLRGLARRRASARSESRRRAT